jgi:hypothetical protein
MRPSFELWGSSLPVTSGYTIFTQERELRFHLKLPHPAGNPEPAAATLPGTLLHRESILFEFGRQFPVINSKFIYEHIGDGALIQQSSRKDGSIAGHPPAFRDPRLSLNLRNLLNRFA